MTRQTTRRFKMTKERVIANILALMFLLLGTVEIVASNNKIIATAGSLWDLADKTYAYNTDYVKTDEDTAEQRVVEKERQAIYNSEDWLIRTYSNLNTILKVIVLLLVIGMYVVVLFGWVILLLRNFFYLKRRVSKKRKR